MSIGALRVGDLPFSVHQMAYTTVIGIDITLLNTSPTQDAIHSLC